MKKPLLLLALPVFIIMTALISPVHADPLWDSTPQAPVTAGPTGGPIVDPNSMPGGDPYRVDPATGPAAGRVEPAPVGPTGGPIMVPSGGYGGGRR